ncbi:hypothetical protein AB6A40_004455 [Gnathostoma spinigerum]|uniref:TRUD domain-containing protein n=1 Tax=Gnathostoma spinigerum TaxID=75299 RepID=A0ABD6EEV2_9BILA
MESEFFITEFVGDFHTRMDCSLKVLFSDFIVNEITSDGKIVVVGSSSEDKEIFQETEGTAGIHPTSIKRKVTRPDSVSDFLESEIDALLIDKRSTVKIPVEGLNKVQRTEIHEWIREKYSEKLNTETKDKAIIVSSTSLRTRKRDSWPSDRPDYCHFTLSKENMDSHYALSLISRFLGRSVASFGVLGTKDRRAVTSQRVSAYHIDRAKISSLNDRLRGIQLSDFCYKDDPCTLGNLWGNRFSIVLRNIPNNFDGDELTKRIDNWKTKGFVNYYGTQRFGSCGLNTAYVGRAILQKHYQEAVRMILQNHQAKGCLGDALTVWNESSDAEAAARHLRGAQTFASIESQILLSLSRSGSDWSAAIRRLPRNSRSLYIHAYQSLVWNKVVSRRIKECGLVQLEGDLDEQGKELEMVDQEATVYLPLPSATMKLPSNRGVGYIGTGLCRHVTWNVRRKLDLTIHLPFIGNEKTLALLDVPIKWNSFEN